MNNTLLGKLFFTMVHDIDQKLYKEDDWNCESIGNYLGKEVNDIIPKIITKQEEEVFVIANIEIIYQCKSEPHLKNIVNICIYNIFNVSFGICDPKIFYINIEKPRKNTCICMYF
jgi:hypothetical protein